MKHINWKKFFLTLIITTIVLLLADIILDYLKKELLFSEIFSGKNLLLKTTAGLILALFVATADKPKE
jgi:hypothetical protein